MSNKHLKLEPHQINDDAWWYEEPKGICVVFDMGTRGVYTIEIPWRKLRLALKRLDKKETP